MIFKSIGITSDHAGKDLKKVVFEFLQGSQINVEDLGVPYESSDSVNYPEFASKLAQKISSSELEAGIAICGTGIGMCITANKFPNVRATSIWNEYSAKMSREHNDSNCICIGSRTLSDSEAIQLIKIWCDTAFLGGRHQDRLDLINRIETNNFK